MARSLSSAIPETTMVNAAGGNGVSYPNGLDMVTDIYDNRVYVTISDEWYN